MSLCKFATMVTCELYKKVTSPFVKVCGITLDSTGKQEVIFDVIYALVYLHAQCHVTGHVSVDIPLKITRDAKTKNIEMKRMKKDYCIVYDKCVIVQDYETLAYGY